MKIEFPCYIASFHCECTMQEAMKIISDTTACNHNSLKILRSYYIDSQKIVLSSSTAGYLYYNSFMPIVYMDIKEVKGGLDIFIRFEIKKSIKIMIMFYAVLALLFEVVLLASWLTTQLNTVWLLGLPLAMLAFALVLTTTGLFFSAKHILDVLYTALTGREARSSPVIHKVKHTRK